MMIRFEDVDLEVEQKELLVTLVEAYRESREEILVIRHSGGATLRHPAVTMDVMQADIRALSRYNLLQLVRLGQNADQYDVTPDGRRYYEWLKDQEGGPAERTETEVRRLLDAGPFRQRHQRAHDRWADAESKLWEADVSNQQFTDIGLACREAVQLLIMDLVEKHQPPGVEPNPEKTINRLKSVAAQAGGSDRVADLTAALAAYFEAVNGLFQRQVHGATKGGEPLAWEDARRVVFQTAMVMFELDSAYG